MRGLLVLLALLALALSAGCMATVPIKLDRAASADSKPLPQTFSGLKMITDSDWDQEVLATSQSNIVLVDFTATWCGPCHRQKPILQELSNELNTVKFVAVDFDTSSRPKSMGIRAIPTLVIYKKGSEVRRFTGLQSKEALRSELQTLLKT